MRIKIVTENEKNEGFDLTKIFRNLSSYLDI